MSSSTNRSGNRFGHCPYSLRSLQLRRFLALCLLQFHDGGRGPLTHLRTAFSRDQSHKIYIQDKIMEDPELIHDYLVNQKGYFYACGSSAVQDLKHYVAKCIATVGQMPEDEAADYVTKMMIENRYCIESW